MALPAQNESEKPKPKESAAKPEVKAPKDDAATVNDKAIVAIDAFIGKQQVDKNSPSWRTSLTVPPQQAFDAKSDYYKCPVEKDSRSVMNVVFRLPTEALEEKFVKDAKGADMVGLKGHRSVGGIRVSMYNAVTLDQVKTLVSFMDDFAKKNG